MHVLPRQAHSFLTARGSVQCPDARRGSGSDDVATQLTQAATRTPLLPASGLTNPSLSIHPFSPLLPFRLTLPLLPRLTLLGTQRPQKHETQHDDLHTRDLTPGRCQRRGNKQQQALNPAYCTPPIKTHTSETTQAHFPSSPSMCVGAFDFSCGACFCEREGALGGSHHAYGIPAPHSGAGAAARPKLSLSSS